MSSRRAVDGAVKQTNRTACVAYSLLEPNNGLIGTNAFVLALVGVLSAAVSDKNR